MYIWFQVFLSVNKILLRFVQPSPWFFLFHLIFLRNYWWQKTDIWSQASYRYAILWEAFLDPLDSYFLFSDLVGFYTHWTYMIYAGVS
jgi:hypothetical protein